MYEKHELKRTRDGVQGAPCIPFPGPPSLSPPLTQQPSIFVLVKAERSYWLKDKLKCTLPSDCGSPCVQEAGLRFPVQAAWGNDRTII